MDMEKMAGWLIIIGSLMFMLAASPIGGEVYGEQNVVRQMEIINGNRRGWVISQILFILASMITVAGFWIFVANLDGNVNQPLVRIATIFFTIGTIIWIIHLVQRAFAPEPVLSGEKSFTPGFIGLLMYAFLSEAALFAYGYAYLRSDYPTWLGYTTIGLAVLLLIQIIVYRGGFIPLLFYIPTFIAGIVFLL